MSGARVPTAGIPAERSNVRRLEGMLAALNPAVKPPTRRRTPRPPRSRRELAGTASTKLHGRALDRPDPHRQRMRPWAIRGLGRDSGLSIH